MNKHFQMKKAMAMKQYENISDEIKPHFYFDINHKTKPGD